MGDIGRIPFTAIDCYARRFDISNEGFHRFCTLIRVLDSEYVMHVREQQKADLEAQKKKAEEH